MAAIVGPAAKRRRTGDAGGGDDGTFEACRRWVHEQGGHVDPSLVVGFDDATGCRGLFASSPIEASAVLLRLPRKCLLFSKETTWFKALKGLGSAASVLRHSLSDVGLGLQLIEEHKGAAKSTAGRSEGAAGDYSFFTPYARTLPGPLDFEGSLPAWWTEEEREALAGSPLLHTVRAQLAALEEDYATLAGHVGAGKGDGTGGLLGALGFPFPVSLREFMWGMALVTSRTIGGDDGEGEG
eukprot:CAMPEP_0182573234 /NCGR_PEP_ID=MMETSP1324-20130603/19031_1 /TAXON_ID=236786 /ORGANISM="Florenciella sp., Strain RCC1587" /LENGTH=239 /DNA_ID=CAMNT_0024788307 /DNA_START=18 /DNA_END=733 /DNA_ORIENTATION=-